MNLEERIEKLRMFINDCGIKGLEDYINETLEEYQNKIDYLEAEVDYLKECLDSQFSESGEIKTHKFDKKDIPIKINFKE